MSKRSGLDGRQLQVAMATRRGGAPIPFVRSNALAPFVSFLSRIGAPADRLLGQARVPPPVLADPEALLPVVSAYRFLELAARQERANDLGLIIGQQASSFDLGAYGAALRGTATVYEYLQIGVRLIGGHSSGISLWLNPEGETLRVNQYFSGSRSPGRCIADLYTLVLTINMLRQFVGPNWSPAEIRLLAGDEVLLGNRDVFGDAQLITGERHSSFTISSALLQLPAPSTPDGVMSDSGARLAAGPSMPADFKTSAEVLIASLLIDGYPSIHSVAEAAGMSARTLQRRLGEANLTYSGLVSASRLRLAKAWLTESDIPIAEVAAMLGYTAASNFARAFRRETGLSPGAYRRTRWVKRPRGS